MNTYKAPSKRDGNVWQITTGKETGRWRWEVEIVVHGAKPFRKAGTRKTKQEAIKARDACYRDFNKSGGKQGKRYTVKTWCEYCLSGGMTSQGQKTRDHYAGWLKTRVYPILGPIYLDELSIPKLQEFYQRIQRDDVPSAAVRVRTALNACLTVALEQEEIPTHYGRAARLAPDPANISGVDEDDMPGKRILTQIEQFKLMKFAREDRIYMFCILGLRFGLRIGECCGLEWHEVDTEKWVIRVRKQVQRVKGQGKLFTGLKTKHSKRDLAIPVDLREEFKMRKEQALQNGISLVCPNLVNGKFIPQDVGPLFKRLCKKAEINEIEGLPNCTHHDLRSTFLTYMANEAFDGKGVRPSVLMRLAGHGKIDVAYRYYIRVTDDDIYNAMNQGAESKINRAV